MVKSGALAMGVVMGAVSAGTYYVLEMLPPGLIPPPIGRVVVAEAPAAPALAAPAPVVAVAPAPAAAPTAAPEADVTEQDLAEEPPPPEAAPAQDEPDAAPAAAAPAPAPAPVEKPAAKVAEKPAPTPAPAQETASAEAPAPAPAPAPSKPASADPIKPWWPDPATLPDTQLKLVSATQVKGQPALALLFSSPVNLDSVKAEARVATSAGTAAAGEWEIGKNPRLVVFRSVDPGRYTVILRPQLADAQGRTLGTLLRGPVDIKEP